MLSCGAPPPPTLAYSPSAVVVTVGSSLRQAPVVNAYCEYSVVPPLPDGLFLNGATGVVSGKSYAPLPATVFTVYAKHAESHALVNATLSLTVLGRAACLSVMLECSSPRHLVRVQWTSLYHSDIEQWELRANDTVVAARSGLDVGDQEVTQSELFCLSPAVYTLHQRLAPSQAPTKAGHLSLGFPSPTPSPTSSRLSFCPSRSVARRGARFPTRPSRPTATRSPSTRACLSTATRSGV